MQLDTGRWISRIMPNDYLHRCLMTYVDSYPGEHDGLDPGLFDAGDPVDDWANEQFFSESERYDHDLPSQPDRTILSTPDHSARIQRADVGDDDETPRQSRVISQGDLPRTAPANPVVSHRRIPAPRNPRLDLLDTTGLVRPPNRSAARTSPPTDGLRDHAGEGGESGPPSTAVLDGESGPEGDGDRSEQTARRAGERDQLLERIAREGGLRHQINRASTRVRKPQFDEETFRCAVNDVKFNASGNLVVTIVIPYEDRDVALKLQDGIGMLLEIKAKGIGYAE